MSDTSQKLPVTVVVPVLNEEKNLAGCLERLGRFARIVVADSGSKDRTGEIAASFGAEVVQFRWNGEFPKKRNWVLRNHRFDTPWVLFLDADEYIDDAFCDELARTLPTTPHVGFWITYWNWFLGKRLEHGEMNRKLALFKVGAGEYERIEEEHWSGLDMEIHEHPVLNGSTGEIAARLDHRDYRGYDHWLRKHNSYSTWEAHRILKLAEQGKLDSAELTPRQRRKYGSIGRFWLPTAYFLATYLGKRGILDGYPGLVYAISKSIYFWEIGVKLREARAARK
jgi:glycosyltransferase involved in cell wall biosynthesis